jgi:hypothetical protein
MSYQPVKKNIEGVEVRGEVIIGIKEVLENSTYRSKGISLKPFNLDTAKPNQWYPLKNLVDFFTYIEESNNSVILQKIGAEVANKALWPDTVQTIRAALESVNLAYHMNHRRNGLELFDYKKGVVIEGYIGHNILEVDDKKETVKYICGSFYPSDFDLGMAKQVVKIFGKNAIAALSVKRDASKPSRKKGDTTCTFNLNYKLLKK